MALIEEFLVSFGIKSDNKQMANVGKGVRDVAKAARELDLAGIIADRTINNLGGSLLEFIGAPLAAVAAFQAMNNTAKNSEGLAFMAKRIGTTTDNIRGMSFAAESLGISTEEMQSSLEGFGAFLRQHPAGIAMLDQWGVKTKDINGKILDTAEILQNVGKYMSGLQEWQIKPYAEAIGITEKLALVLRNNNFQQYADEYANMARSMGTSTAELDATFNRYMQAVRGLEAVGGARWRQVAAPAAEGATNFLTNPSLYIPFGKAWREDVYKTGGEVLRGLFGVKSAPPNTSAPLTSNSTAGTILDLFGGSADPSSPNMYKHLQNFNQTNNITVTNSDPQAIAQAVGVATRNVIHRAQ
jgi:hypothetical protein